MTIADDSPRYRGPILLALAILLLGGCAPAPARESAGRQEEPSSRPVAQRKAITIAIKTDVNALVGDAERFGGQIVASVYVQEFINAYLSVRDQADEPQAQLARELPSFEKGTWKLFDDGRMEATWKLRQDARWHDGTPVSAGDVRFGWEVAIDPASAIGLQPRGIIRLIERIETPDPTTVVMHWRGPSIRGGELGVQELAVLPSHLLGAAFAEGKETFHRHPYFSSPESFVGSGPYRPIERELDRQLTVAASDGYFLGRPKVDRVTFQIIPDSRTALANVLAGGIDISYVAVEFNEAITVRDEWARSGLGTVWLQPNQLRIVEPQMRLEHARPADLMNPDIRRALAYAMDRPSIAEAANPGAAMVADSDGVPGTRYGEVIRARAFRYDYNPGRAQALLVAAGWHQGGDGSLDKAGQRFQLELFADRGPEQEGVFSVMRENYRQIGVDLAYREVPRDAEGRATYSGLRHRGAFTNEPRTVQRFHSSQIASAANVWAGINLSGINLPALDRVIESMERSVRTDEQAGYVAEVWQIVTEEAMAVGLYIRPFAYIIRKGITGPIPSSLSGSLTSNVQLWESG